MSPDATKAPAPARRKLLRAAAYSVSGLLVTVALAYAALPWWLPVHWIQDRLARQLSADLQSRVTIGSLSISWTRGIQLSNVRVQSSSEPTLAPLVTAGFIQLPLQPLRIALAGTPERLVVDGLHLSIEFDADGKPRGLPALRRGGSPPPRFTSYEIRNLTCHLKSPDHEQSVRFDGIGCHIDPHEGTLRVTAHATSPARPSPDVEGAPYLLIDARLTLPRGQPSRRFGGEIQVDWRNLALQELPLAFARLPVSEITGYTSGKMVLHPHPDLGVEFDVQTTAQGVVLPRKGPRASRPLYATLRTRGQWDPSADQVELSEFTYETAGLRLHRMESGPAFSLDTRGVRPFSMRLAGEIKDWPTLAQELPEVRDYLATNEATLDGQANFTLELNQRRQDERFALSVDATRTRLVIGAPQPSVDIPGGVAKQFSIELLHDRLREHLSEPQIRLTLGSSTLTFRSEIPIPETSPADRIVWMLDAAQRVSWRLGLATGDVAELRRYAPHLARHLDLGASRGPLKLAALLEPRAGRAEMRLSLEAPEQTSLVLGDLLRKPVGERMDLSAIVALPPGGAELEAQIGLTMGVFTTTIQQAKIRSSFRFSDPAPAANEAASPDIDIHADLPLSVAAVERLGAISPRLGKAIPADLRVTGAAQVEGHLLFSRRGGDWTLLSRARLVGSGLAIECPAFHKSASEPLFVSVQHRFATVDGQREQSAGIEVSTRPARLTAQLAFAGIESEEPADDYEQWDVQVNVEDAPGAIAMFPALASQLAGCSTQGRCSLHVSDFLLGDRQSLALALDAKDLDVRLATSEQPLVKRAGVPAQLNLGFTGRSRAGDPVTQDWHVDQGRFVLGGISTTDFRGQLTLATPLSPGGRTQPLPWAARPSIREATLDVGGVVALTPSLADLNPAIRRAFRNYRVGGSCKYRWQLRAVPRYVDLTGSIDASDAAFRADLPEPSTGRIEKARGAPANLSIEARVVPENEHDLRVRLTGAELNTDTNHVQTDGAFVIRRPLVDASLASVALTTHVRVTDLRPLQQLIPASQFQIRDGIAEAEVKLIDRDGALAIQRARVDLDRIAVSTPADVVHCSGGIVLEGERFRADQLRLSWGPSTATIFADVTAGAARAQGNASLAVRHVDLPDLQARLKKCESETKADSAGGPGLREIVQYLRRSRLNIQTDADSAIFRLPLDVSIVIDALNIGVDDQSGQAKLTFRGLVDAGIVSGSVTSNLNAPDPTFYLNYSAERIQPGPLVDKYLGLTFPGMKATGPLTIIDETTQKLFPAPGEPNAPIGIGEIIIDGGTIEGRATPDWVMKVFPRLNLAAFEFSYMHSWFTKTVDGRIRHQMIYRGRFYNIYAVGYSNEDGHIDYEVGLDFLADFDSKYWANSGQGRIPLFHKTGVRGPDGKLQNEVVSYTPPQRVLDALLVKNNPLVTAYHAVRKRVLKEK